MRIRSHPPIAFNPGVIDLWDHENDTTEVASQASITRAADEIDLEDPDNEADEELAMAWYHEL